MISLLKEGQTVYAQVADGRRVPCQVEAFIGSGGQGEVHRASLAGRQVALKWYNESMATDEQRKNLVKIIKHGQPSETFLWPMYLAVAPEVPYFGYIMPLKEERFKGIPDLVTRRIEPSFRAVTTAGFHLAHSFWQLYKDGLCYRDISSNNIFIDPENGDIRIADNDNVAIDAPKEAALVGTPYFMAPEFVRGDAPPSIYTDLYSLAVLLFQMFVMEHPLHGARWFDLDTQDQEAVIDFYGHRPLFILDRDDPANGPVPGEHDNVALLWPLYPRYIRDKFRRSFTTGLHDPDSRVRATDWRSDLVRLRDSIVYCSECWAENFYDKSELKRCWSCGEYYEVPPHLHIEYRGIAFDIMLNYDVELYPHHLAFPRSLYDFSQPLAKVVQNRQRPDIWGLKNLSSDTWLRVKEGSQQQEVLPGQVTRLLPGTKIQFGRVMGELRPPEVDA